MGAETVTISTVITSVGEVFGGVIDWLGTALDTVVNNPVLFIMVIGIPLAGAGIGFLRRLMSL